MKGHKNFLKIDFAIQTILIGVFILLKILSPKFAIDEDAYLKMGIPILAIWLIVTGTINKIKFNNNSRFLINRVWFFIFFFGLIFFFKEMIITTTLTQIFTLVSWGMVLINYFSVIYEYYQLEREPPGNSHFEDILDDNNF